jgi:hypothetical protein
MKPGRVIALIVGCLLLLPGLGLLLGGSALAMVYAAARDDQGYVNASPDRLSTSSVAIRTDDVDFGSDAEVPDELIDALDVDMRLRVTGKSGRPLFVGIARTGAVDAYLAATANDVVADVRDGGAVTYRHRSGDLTIAPPTEQKFWVRSKAGGGTQTLNWPVETGRWSAVLMNADGSPGVSAKIEVGTKAAFVFPVALSLAGLGLVMLVLGLVLILVGALIGTGQQPDVVPTTAGAAPAEPAATGTPVLLTASLDPALSRGMWLIKWFLAIPHFVLLAFLWLAFFVLTMVTFFAILVTGRYPKAIFDFNVGVLRWTWRVSYYATSGGLGTDRYPPFSLTAQPGEPASLEIAYPERLSRGLVLVKWWLLAIPHYLVLGVLLGGTGWWAEDGRVPAGGLLGLLVFIAAVTLLFTGRYPATLFDLVIGLNRWLYRVVAYVALMTDVYPPFRLDQGGAEPQRVGSPPTGPTTPVGPAPGTTVAVPGARDAETLDPQPTAR